MFRKTTQETAPARGRPAAEPMAGSTFSILGPDVTIKGDIAATADLHIDGKVEGDIACAALDQGAASEITGAVRADNARLAGKVRGSINASSLVILKSAHIEGDVHYDTLTIEPGAFVDGRFAQRASAEITPLVAGKHANDASALLLTQASDG